MNWSKLTPELKDNVLDILVDNILVSDNYDFRERLLAKLKINNPPPLASSSEPSGFSKSSFGKSSDYYNILIAILILGIVFYLLSVSGKIKAFPKMS